MTHTEREIEPEIGMGVTMSVGSDRYAGTIVSIGGHRGSRMITVIADKAKLISGNIQSEDQVYKYTPNPKGEKRYFVRIHGHWIEHYYRVIGTVFNKKTGDFDNKYSTRLSRRDLSRATLGVRETYRDPSF
jgi:hypothetical protein